MQRNTNQRRNEKLWKLTITAMLAALSAVLMFFSFSVPLMPDFIKLDFSEVPALVASFILGPVSGIAVCLVKNLINVMFTTTGGVGELCNFILGALMVLPAGLIHKKWPTYKGALLGALAGAFSMAIISVAVNYFLVYPVYTAFMPMEGIIGLYQAINPSVNNLLDALVMFNMPFTFIKGMLCFVITSVLYLPLMPALRKNKLLGY